MSTVKKPAVSKSTSKKVSAKLPAHPPWADMIKECITAHPEDARQGVSRPQIKKFVEMTYKVEMGNAQLTQLSRAIATGADKGTLVLPKGPSGRVKLPLKNATKADPSDAKENKPAATKPVSKINKANTTTTKATRPAAKTTKTGPKTAASKKLAATKSALAKPSIAKSPAKARTAGKAKQISSKVAASKPQASTAKKAVKGRPSKSKTTVAKKATSSSRRDSAKKVVTGKTPASKPRASRHAPQRIPARRSGPTMATSTRRKSSAKK